VLRENAALGRVPDHQGLCGLAVELLTQRGLAPAEWEGFLNPRLATLADPLALPGMDAAVRRLLEAIDKGQGVGLYGDYDVDGVTSQAVMGQVLQAYGCQPRWFVPSRLDEGYGLSRAGLERFFAESGRPSVLVVMDCGTTSVAEVAWLAEQGVDCVIIDHHELSPLGIPAAAALVNPKLGETHRDLCTVGLVFKVAHALLKTRPLPEFDLKSCLDLVAMGTVADMVPLRGENRVLVRRGLEILAQTRRQGLCALMEVAGVKPEGGLQASQISYRLGPRINASGRLDQAMTSLQLLLCEDPQKARALADELEACNRERQSVESSVHQDAMAQLQSNPDWASQQALVLGSPDWHPGVIGIVASRLCRAFNRPCILFAFDAQGVGKGSGRSVEGFSLVEAMALCRDHLTGGGGHAMAAGFSLHRDQLDAFRRAFVQAARQALGEEPLAPLMLLDGDVELADLKPAFLDQYRLLEPFGMGNPEPVLRLRGVEPQLPGRVVGGKHLMFKLRQHGAQMDACWFSAPLEQLPAPPWDVAVKLSHKVWRGRRTWSLFIEAACSSAAADQS
jgi:single-stranded-DNA-specific exonuclease